MSKREPVMVHPFAVRKLSCRCAAIRPLGALEMVALARFVSMNKEDVIAE